MSRILSFRDLEVWQLGMELVVRVYKATATFPASERYGLSAQMQRASVSIPSNIAEGNARRDGAYLNHVRIALGSQAELVTEIEVAARLGYLDAQNTAALLREVESIRRMLYRLREALQRKRKVAFTSVVALLFCITSVLT